MHPRNVVRLVVVAAVSFLTLYAPSQEQCAFGCPYAYEYRWQFWDDPECAPGTWCEQTEPQLIGTYIYYCDQTEVCVGVCSAPPADRIVLVTRHCEYCPPE